jgi:uncharacterized protein (DUF4415 family)
MHKANRKRNKEIAALKKMKDDQIDTSDIPEMTDWSGAVVGKFFRPIKEPVTIRIDADVLDWLKSKGKGYQTRINQLLRAAMQQSKARKRA